ncbi:MAG: type II toxin-antitoxin system Phd/YefM family antitoxin [Candidatus Desantisbacteria bacterium]
MAVEILPISEARLRLPQMVKDVDRLSERFIITQNGKPKAVIMSLEEYEEWSETLTILSDREAIKGIKRGLEDLKADRTKKFEEVFGESLNLKVKISHEAEKAISQI